MGNKQGLTDVQMMLLIGWNLAAGYWSRIGLSPAEAKELMFNFAAQVASKPVRTRELLPPIQQALMALRKDPFEVIQGEAPFRPHAQANMKRLLNAYIEGGDSGLDAAWAEVFSEDQEVQPADYQPIRVVGGNGKSKETALEVVGAPDQETRVAAEWWYLRYTFGWAWQPGVHATTTNDENGNRFSVHDGQLLGGSRKKIFFRLPW
jgi:hypothetical protein